MAPRPAKRQRRSTIVLSEDSDDSLPRGPLQPSQTTLQREITRDGRASLTVSPVKTPQPRVKAKSHRPVVKASPKSSPDKARKTSKSKADNDASTSLHSFFSVATEEQRWKRKSATPDVERENGELGDAIEDDELSDETLEELGVKVERPGAAGDRRTLAPNPLRTSANGAAPSAATRRFVNLKSTRAHAHPGQARLADPESLHHQEYSPWADRYGPTSLDELVVHKKKVADVQSWLQAKIHGRNSQKLLILKGPAGSGKSTTLSLLAKSMGLSLIHWHNPAVSDMGANGSVSAQFHEFFNRGGHFGRLALDHGDPRTAQDPNDDSTRRVLVVEEFPAVFSRNSTSQQGFRAAILQFLARTRAAASAAVSSQVSHDNLPPAVIIISETLLSSSTALSDSFTAHRLLGPDIMNHPYVTTVEFNPVAVTFVTKALDLVIKKEARDSNRRRVPGPAVIQSLADMGDVRSAVNSLEFLCLRRSDDSDWSGTVAARAKKSARDKGRVPLTEMETDSLKLVSQRETTLDMFHATGKVVYNKRQDPAAQDPQFEPPLELPDHLRHSYKPKASQVDVEALLNETGTDIQTFISALHENYVLSCNGESFEESCDGCADILSTSDILSPDTRLWRRNNANPNIGVIQANLQSGSSDTLRQDEISFQLATRGLLFNLPYPVTRASPPGGKKGDTFKMFYPTSLRLWKPLEEMESLVDMFAHGDALASALSGNSPTAKSSLGDADRGVASWQPRSFAPFQADVDDESPEADLDPRAPRYAKDTLVLEVLPFTARMLAARKMASPLLDRMTAFKPSMFPSSAGDQDELGLDDELDNAATGRSNVVPRGEAAPDTLHRITGASSFARASKAPKDEPAITVEKLYISDDDIEDD